MVAEKVEAALRLISKNSAIPQLVRYPGCLASAHTDCRAEDMPENNFAVYATVDGLGEIQSCQILAGIGEPEEAQDCRAPYSSLGGNQCPVLYLVQDYANL